MLQSERRESHEPHANSPQGAARALKRHGAFTLVTVLTAVYGLGIALLPPGSFAMHVWVDVGWTAMCGWAALENVRVVRHPHTPKRAQLAFAIANFSWLLGLFVWDTYELVWREMSPFPSLADAGFLSFAPLYAFGMFALGQHLRTPSWTLKQLADLGIVVSTSLLCALVLYADPGLGADKPTLTVAITLGYPLLFLSAFVFAFLTFMHLRTTALRDVAARHLLSLTLHAIAFTAYGVAIVSGSYEAGHELDPIWFAGFGCSAWAARSTWHASLDKAAPETMRHRIWDGVLPAIACGAVAFTVLANDAVAPHFPLAALVPTVMLFVLMLALRGFAMARLERDLMDTVQKRERELMRAQQMEAVGTLAGGLAHDFNNLLTGIMGLAGLVRTQVTRGGPQDELLMLIEQTAQRASELTKRLLVLGRRRSGQKHPVQMAAVVARVEALLRSSVRSNVRIVSKVDEALWVQADENQLEQALLNLALNGAQAMPEGGTLEISMEAALRKPNPDARDPRAYVVVRVRDEGIGIPEDLQTRIFEPYFTTKEAGEGSGLGLAMVYHIAREHEGFVSCTSRPGQGATFELALPRTEALPKRVSDVVPSSSGSLPRGSESVLVVDDRESPLLTAKLILESLGYTVWTAPEARTALKIVTERPDIALVLTDSIMPTMGGRQLLKALRARGFTRPIILVTGYEQEQTSAHEDFAATITKPFSTNELATTVRRVLDATHEKVRTAAALSD